MTHECEQPKPGWQGEDWVCPECGSWWWSDEVGYDAATQRSEWRWVRHDRDH